MNAREVVPPDYLLGVEDGERRAAALGASALMKAQERMRKQADEIAEMRAFVRYERRKSARLRSQLATPRRMAFRWALAASLFTAIAVYNLTLHGVTL